MADNKVTDFKAGRTELGGEAAAVQGQEGREEFAKSVREKIDLSDLRIKEQILKDVQAKKAKKSEFLEGMNPTELYNLRHEIDELLPALGLADMNLEQELVVQYQLAKALQKSVLEENNKGVPDKEKSQLLRAATTTLQALISLQNEVYTTERLKFVEGCIKTTFQDFPLDIRTKFFESYEKLLKASLK